MLLNDKSVQPSKKKELVQSLLSYSQSLGNLFSTTQQSALSKQVSTQNLLHQLVTHTRTSQVPSTTVSSKTARRQSLTKICPNTSQAQRGSSVMAKKHSQTNISQREINTKNALHNNSRLTSKLESTKELILLMQNKLTASKKSKSVENLNQISHC